MPRLLLILLILAVSPARAQAPACATPSAVGLAATSVTIQPATYWQPRGGQVNVAIAVPEQLALATVDACFGWLPELGSTAFTNTGAVARQPSDTLGVTNWTVTVPHLGPPPTPVQSTGLGAIPLASLRLIGRTAAGTVLFDEVRSIGVSTLWLALPLAGVAILVGLVILAVLRPPAHPPVFFLLRAITTRSGTAGLAQAQILLWTFLVAASAVYVMSLTGTLLAITDGTLTLLGIAAVAQLGAALQPPVSNAQVAATQAAGLQPGMPGFAPRAIATAAPPNTPCWYDLISAVDGSDVIDITRVQMLFFTFVTAGFVLVKVLNDFAIPTIPPSYLLLMGISNGTYLAGRTISLRT